MGRFTPEWSKIHNNNALGLWSFFLAFPSFCYGVGVRVRLKAYSLGLLRKIRLPGFVVSVGNLTVGGTGKTPTVVMLAKWALQQGYRVAVLSRGYGGTHSGKVLEVSDGKDLKTGPDEAGDEAYLLATNLNDIPIVVSKNRYFAGIEASRRLGSDFFILDDGYQHIELERDLDILLVDSSSPFGNWKLLPGGPLREPIDQLGRADIFIATHFEDRENDKKTVADLQKKFPETPIFRGKHVPDKFVFGYSNERKGLEYIKGKRVMAFAGIAKPDAFENTLAKLGAKIVFFMSYRDHYKYREREIQGLIGMMEAKGAECLLTTEKDWVRISSLIQPPSFMGYLRIKFSLLAGSDSLLEMIEIKYNSVSGSRLRVNGL